MIYIIPFKEISTSIGKYGGSFRTLVDIEGYGFYVYHDKDQDVSDAAFIKKHLRGLDDQREALVEADNPKQALEKLFSEWEGFNFGTHCKAREISRRSPIIEYPGCKDMVDMVNGHLGCAKGEWNGRLSPKQESYCGCFLEGFVRPKNCPIANDKEIMRISFVDEIIDGYTFRRSSVRKDFGIKTRGLKDDKANEIVFKLYKQKALKTLQKIGMENFSVSELQKGIYDLEKVYKNITDPDRYY